MRMFIESLEVRRFLSTTLMKDTFDGSAVNSSRWSLPVWDAATQGAGTFYGRTQQRVAQNAPLPPVSGGRVHLGVDSYNPTMLPGHPSFYGYELVSRKTFTVGTGLELKVVARLKGPINPGMVGGMFLYFLRNPQNHDEIDFEALSNQAKSGSNRVLTNVYKREAFGAGTPQFVKLPAGKLTDFHTFIVKVGPKVVRWFVDGKLVRTETVVVPKEKFQVRLNAWVPAADFGSAYSAGVQPVSEASKNLRVGELEVSSVEVKRFVDTTSVPTPTLAPGIHIERVPPLGQAGSAQGRVVGLPLSSYDGAAVYILVRGGWWTKPTWAEPLSRLNSDGSWSANIVTGGVDEEATEIRAYLIPKGFAVPLAGGGGLPDSLGGLKFDSVKR